MRSSRCRARCERTVLLRDRECTCGEPPTTCPEEWGPIVEVNEDSVSDEWRFRTSWTIRMSQQAAAVGLGQAIYAFTPRTGEYSFVRIQRPAVRILSYFAATAALTEHSPISNSGAAMIITDSPGPVWSEQRSRGSNRICFCRWCPFGRRSVARPIPW